MVFNWIHFRRVVTTLASQLVPLMIKRRRRRRKRTESFLIRLHRLCLLSSWHSGRPRSESRLVKESSSTPPPDCPRSLTNIHSSWCWKPALDRVLFLTEENLLTGADLICLAVWNPSCKKERGEAGTLKVHEWTNYHIPTFTGVRSILPRESDFLSSWLFMSPETPPWVRLSGQKVEGTQTTPEFL